VSRTVAIVVGFSGLLLFLFVPETFWDRTPRPKSRRPTAHRTLSNLLHPLQHKSTATDLHRLNQTDGETEVEKHMTPRQHRLHDLNVHAHFEDGDEISESKADDEIKTDQDTAGHDSSSQAQVSMDCPKDDSDRVEAKKTSVSTAIPFAKTPTAVLPRKILKPTSLAMPPSLDPRTLAAPWDGTQDGKPKTIPITPPDQTPTSETDPSVPHLHNLNSPFYAELEKSGDYLDHHATVQAYNEPKDKPSRSKDLAAMSPVSSRHSTVDLEKSTSKSATDDAAPPKLLRYTTNLRHSPPKSYLDTLRPWNGRLTKANWFRVALRPFILYAYPSILWSALVYSLSIGWLIVLSESITNIYKNRDTYNFTSLQAGLVYISPFVGGVLGTAVAGKVSDVIVRYMARKNGGVYEPEFRLVMAIPVAISTAIGLMGFGWSAEERDAWIVPTVFFGIISFGCSLGSTTAITFCVDSYRQFAGEALVTLNFSKNIFHGLVFSLFFANWLESDGPKTTFLAIGGIQVACMLFTIPMYVYGKRARMWTVRQGFMEKF
jgi:hypothetical protein